MSKKSAFALAAAVAVTLVAAIAAFGVNLGLVGAAGDPPGPGKLDRAPIVRTVRQTVHVPAKRSDQGVEVVRVAAPASSASSAGPATGDDEYEDDEGYEDEHESEGAEPGSEDDGEHDFGETDDD